MTEQRDVHVLVVDDDEALRELLVLVLEGEGYTVHVAGDAGTALEMVGDAVADLVVLDVGLGEDDGRVVLAQIRKTADLPIILISGQGDTADRVLGLRLGADDFVPKPFSPVELVARVESVLRRSRPREPLIETSTSGLHINERTREVRLDDRLVELTAKEFDLLAFLARSPRQVFNRGQLLQQVWQSSSQWQDDATVTEHVRRVRHKLERDPDHPRWITTVRGVGYRFDP
jgi:DNA-binding response OmpR family regulator